MWLYIWGMQGRSPLRSLTYGARYPGLQVSTPARPLRQGKIYEIWITDLNFNATHTLTFTINSAGNVVELPRK
jgi:hypothetical protein